MERETPQTNGHVQELTQEEGRELFDRQAPRYLNMSGDEVIRAWDAGEFDDPDDRSKNGPEVMRVAMLLPLVR